MMSKDDIDTIRAYAMGDKSKFDAAIDAHRRNIPIVGVRGNIYQQYMAEVDNPVPDFMLRAHYRAQILREVGENS